MRNLRLSVTDLDAYLFFKNSDQEPEELMRRLRREEPPTPAMATGSAFHTALEFAQAGTFIALEAEGYTFNVLGDVTLALPELRELKAEQPVYINPTLGVTLVGKVDAIEGLTVHDHKTTAKFDSERFFDAYQWRFYLEMFKADTFQWNCFELKETGFKEYDVTGFHQLRQYRYPGMAADCADLLREFLEFLGISQMRFPKDQSVPLATLLKANRQKGETMSQVYKGMLSIDRTDAEREKKRQALNAAEANFKAAFEDLLERTDLRRCMDALAQFCEGQASIEMYCGGRSGADRWNEKAEMLFDLGEQFQGMD